MRHLLFLLGRCRRFDELVLLPAERLVQPRDCDVLRGPPRGRDGVFELRVGLTAGLCQLRLELPVPLLLRMFEPLLSGGG